MRSTTLSMRGYCTSAATVSVSGTMAKPNRPPITQLPALTSTCMPVLAVTANMPLPNTPLVRNAASSRANSALPLARSY